MTDSEASGQADLERHLDRLLTANGPALLRLAASYTNTVSDRDDLLQEITIAVWRALGRFRGECSERTFLFRIAHNRAISHLTRSRSRPSAQPEIDAPDPALNPEAAAAQVQRAEQLRRAVRALPAAYRQVVTLSLEGCGYGEIAEVIGISENAVGARLTRARQLLRDRLEKQS